MSAVITNPNVSFNRAALRCVIPAELAIYNWYKKRRYLFFNHHNQSNSVVSFDLRETLITKIIFNSVKLFVTYQT
jgi:hypothetical protein